jgi:hypothetical protein
MHRSREGDRLGHRRLKAARQQIAQSREDTAGLGTTDILRDRFGSNVEQRVAGEVAAFIGQTLHRVGNQPHGTLQVDETSGMGRVHHQFSRPPATPDDGASRSPALASATANTFNLMAATRDAVGAIITSSDASSGPS